MKDHGWGIWIVEEKNFEGDDIWVVAESGLYEDEAHAKLEREYFGQGRVAPVKRDDKGKIIVPEGM